MVLSGKGVIVAADKEIEWLLPWWWKHYHSANRYPVTFFDLGLSPVVKAWCQKRGSLQKIAVPPKFIKEVDPLLLETWKSVFSEQRIWRGRQSRFLKPLACKESPYETTLWLDVDCEVRGDLTPLMECCVSPNELAICKLPEKNIHLRIVTRMLKEGQTAYNSGVLVFPKNSSFIEAWSQRALTDNGRFIGDQDLLTDVILTVDKPFLEMDLRFNWSPLREGENREALIYHWVAEGKNHLRSEAARLNLRDFLC